MYLPMKTSTKRTYLWLAKASSGSGPRRTAACRTAASTATRPPTSTAAGRAVSLSSRISATLRSTRPTTWRMTSIARTDSRSTVNTRWVLVELGVHWGLNTCDAIYQWACLIRLPIPAPLVKARRWGQAKESATTHQHDYPTYKPEYIFFYRYYLTVLMYADLFLVLDVPGV